MENFYRWLLSASWAERLRAYAYIEKDLRHQKRWVMNEDKWEDMKMLAEGNTTMNRAISGIWQLTDDDIIREQCRAREECIISDNRKT